MRTNKKVNHTKKGKKLFSTYPRKKGEPKRSELKSTISTCGYVKTLDLVRRGIATLSREAV